MAAALLQLKLTLAGVKPPIWRRLLVTNQVTLERLHESIQAVAGWKNTHLHEFVIEEKRYGQPAPREVVPVQNEALFRLHSVLPAKGTSFTYVYDFGDHWEIEVKVEQVHPPDPRAPFAFVIDGARAFPPEDAGGVAGYSELLHTLSDSERFDLEAANGRLSLLA